ncbi:MAG: alanine:cation symporter family protein [Chlorobi bacterium]|nr:alanine:cation symporter family protein [Chlorobiota bacterium]
MEGLESSIITFADWIWGIPLLILLMGGGFFFLIYSGFIPFRYLRHAYHVLRGRYDNPDDPGQINHFEALSTALAATVGMGNISGVAIAIATGGPGAIFWMWVIAIVGMATKFFTATLAVMFRGKDTLGILQGGPMYVIREGLGKKWIPLAVFFSLAGLIGSLPIFQANQLTAILHDVLIRPQGIAPGFASRSVTGLVLIVLVSVVIFGGIRRIGKVASKMVPIMVVLYFFSVGYILIVHHDVVLHYFKMIFVDAFSAVNYHGQPVLGGALGGLIILGARRAAFSNEAGIGTAPMAHGAAKTTEPVREGLVAMLGPAIDTLVVCTLTGLAILVTGVWLTGDVNGISLTVRAFNEAMPQIGSYILMLCVLIFALSTMFSYSYYGIKCFSFLAGAQVSQWYNYFYVAAIFAGAVASLTAVESLISGSFALMAIPTMTSALILAPKVRRAARDYFRRMKAQNLL